MKSSRNPKKFNYKVRFSLQKGSHYNHWQIERVENGKTVQKIWLNPLEYRIILKGCFLRNQKLGAEKIFATHKKEVVAWVECEDIDIKFDGLDKSIGELVDYNPHLRPNWHFNGLDVDYHTFDILMSFKSKLYTIDFIKPKDIDTSSESKETNEPRKAPDGNDLPDGVVYHDKCYQYTISFE